MRLTLISPRLAVQKGDFLGSGVPYWPIELAVLAAFLQARGEQVRVIDLFGTQPTRLSDQGDYYLQGVEVETLVTSEAVRSADAFVLYALSYMSHRELLHIARTLKRARPDTAVLVLENSQAVTAYSVPRMAASFFASGVDGLLCGDAYFNWDEIVAWIADPAAKAAPDNVVAKGTPAGSPVKRRIEKNARYPVPAWNLFNLHGYWALPYSHGPKSGRYLPILTSRGCPYPCDFCVVPETNEKRWRPRTPDEVVNEMLALRDQFGVRHFQVEDLNPTVKSNRWTEICRLLLQRQAGVFFSFVSGTKAETVRLEQVPLLAQAGCRYISISPESGSADVMKAIRKPFDYEHGLKLVAACRAHGIRTQACFLVGHPAETEADHVRSREYLRHLVRAGLDEVAVFIVAPFAGSALFARDDIAMNNSEALPSFSPRGRAEYTPYERRRQDLIRVFFREKLKKGLDLWMQGLRALLGRPQTKMENLPRRILFVWALVCRHRLRARFGWRAA